MKITKTLAALCVLGAGLMAITSCKDSSGDMAVTGAVSGVPAKYALEVTVDATGDEIKVGKKAISDSNEGTEVEIVENTVEGKTTPAGHETEQQQCGKRAFKEISSGLNNNCGFRTNIVLDTTKGTWLNSETSRKANVGMLFDFKQYNGKFDFFYISFVPQFSGSSVTGVTCYFERYSEVKKCIETFIYGVNTPSRWGTQAPFSNITLDWTVPDDLAELQAANFHTINTII